MTETYEERSLKELEEARNWITNVIMGNCPNKDQPNAEAITQLSNVRVENINANNFLIQALLAGIPLSYLRSWATPKFIEEVELQWQKTIEKFRNIRRDQINQGEKNRWMGIYKEVKEARRKYKSLSWLNAKKNEYLPSYKTKENSESPSFNNTQSQRPSIKKQSKRPKLKASKPEALPQWATFLDQLPNEYIPIPWLIDGLIRVGERSDMYGQAGAGKTYLALDMGFSIAQGKPWMGRNTLEGLVLYIASENPQSVEARMRGFKTHYNYSGDGLCIYKKPFDLFNSDKDSNDLIEFIDTASNAKGKPFRLIIFDTLSKVMVGANENLTADMNRVMAKIDRVIANAQAHCMVLHHSGKDESKGARGSNSLLGAIDTELKVQRLRSTRYIEVTKQRDGEDGTKIGFDLQSTILKDQEGNPILNEKGEPLNIAIVVSKDTPTTLAKSLRVNKIEKAILSELENTEGLNKTQFVIAIANKVGHSKTNHVYIKIAYLISIGKIIQIEKDGELRVSLPP